MSGDYMNYTVHIPPTPDNQPMDNSIAAKAEEQYVSNSLFTGGFNSVTRAHLMDKVIESEVTHPQMAGAKGASCAMSACDGKVMKDERGNDIMPCACRYIHTHIHGITEAFILRIRLYFVHFIKKIRQINSYMID